MTAREVRHAEEAPRGGEPHAALTGRRAGPPATHLCPGEDITAKRLERQMVRPSAHHAGRLPRGGPRFEQTRSPPRGLRGGPEVAGAGPAPARPRCVQGFPELPRHHRRGGLSLQGDHRELAPLRARSGQPSCADRPERAGRQGAGADRPSVPLRAEPARAAARRRVARRGRQRGPAPSVFLGLASNAPTRWTAGTLTVPPAGAPPVKSRSRSPTCPPAFPSTPLRGSSIPFFTTKPPARGPARARDRPGHRGRPRRRFEVESGGRWHHLPRHPAGGAERGVGDAS